MARTGRRTRSPQPSSHATRNGPPSDDEPPDAQRRGGVRPPPRRDDHRGDRPRHVAEHPEAERRREVVGEHQLVVGGVVQRLPRDDGHGDRPATGRAARTTATLPAPGAPWRSGRDEHRLVARRLEREPDRLSLGPGTEQQAADQQRQGRRRARRRSGAPSPGTGCRPRACSSGPPSAFWIPVGVGSTTIGAAQQQQAAAREEPGEAERHAAGRTSVTTTAPDDRRPDRQAAGVRFGAARLGRRPPWFMAGCSGPAIR